jgi:2-dehydro-3-deoxyphosphogluconate aldolase / (4S)-4-hydroxy-2-oxoglutarate aldolase
MLSREQVCARIKQIGILPAIRASSPEDALFAAEQLVEAGIGVVEVTMTVPNAVHVIRELIRSAPELIVGAGTVVDVRSARECVDAGAAFITSPGFNSAINEYTVQQNVVSIPGALTPSEVMAAIDSGGDMIKIFPCSSVGGPAYIKSLKAPFPETDFLASGGVDQVSAAGFIRAGVVAIGVGSELIPPTALQLRDRNWIHELAGRFMSIVQRTRAEVHHPK